MDCKGTGWQRSVLLKEHMTRGRVLSVVKPRGKCELEAKELYEELSLLVQICIIANSTL